MVLGTGIVGHVQVPIEEELRSAGIITPIRQIAFCQLRFQLAAHGHVQKTDVQNRLLLRHGTMNAGNQNGDGDEDQDDRHLLIQPDVFQLLFRGQCMEPGFFALPFFGGQLHCAASSASGS